MTWIVFESEAPGDYDVGAFGRFHTGRPVQVAPEVAEVLLGPHGHPGFRKARPSEIPHPERADRPAPVPLGKAAKAIAAHKSRNTTPKEDDAR